MQPESDFKWNFNPTPPPTFFHKNIIRWELLLIFRQRCDSKVFGSFQIFRMILAQRPSPPIFAQVFIVNELQMNPVQLLIEA